jgi:Proline racemase
MMSGSVLYPATRDDCDIGIVFIETSGCLPMCGHGTIGTVTVAVERGLVTPREEGLLRLDTPAGCRGAYKRDGEHVDSVRLTNVPGYLHAEGVRSTAPAWASSPSTFPMAAISTPSSSRRRTTATWRISRPARSCASRPSCAGC